jgi:hypothetical protein
MVRAPLLTVLAAFALTTAANAQTTTYKTPSPAQVKAARLATQKAESVTLALMNGSSQVGTVGLQQIGRTRTRVTITLKNPLAPPAMSIVPGSYCSSNRGLAQGLVQNQRYSLSPVNSSSGVSQSIVQLPISDLRKGNYAVLMRTVNKQNAISEACGSLR